MAKAKQPPKSLKFEAAISQLEQIIDQVESGQIGLEEALNQYETGMGLIKHCRGILEKAEAKIAELTEDSKGKLQVQGEGDVRGEYEEEDMEYDDDYE